MPLGLARFYPPRNLRIVKGYMQYLWTSTGEKLLDYNTGHGSMFLGHSNPRILGAVEAQLRLLQNPGGSLDTPALDYALSGLEGVAPKGLDTVFFQNSGAEAVEAALKIAWLYTGRRGVVAFRRGFHGRTLAAASVTWNPAYKRGLPVLEDIRFAPYNGGANAIEEAFRDPPPAAVIVEPVLGEGGVIPAEKGFLREVERIARERGSLLIIDEIQAGYGRTGTIWSHQQYGVSPDILLAGKPVAGGLPASIVFTREELASTLRGGLHGSTFAGNPVVLAAIGASSRLLLEDRVPERASSSGRLLQDMLRDSIGELRCVRSVRGAGLMVGVDLRYKPGPILSCLQERRILALKAGATTVRFLPPYMAGEVDHEWVVESLRYCLRREYSC